MNRARIGMFLVLLTAFAITSVSAAPLLNGPIDTAGASFTEFGPACCRFSNECPGSEKCGDETGCSAGAPYHCVGATEIE